MPKTKKRSSRKARPATRAKSQPTTKLKRQIARLVAAQAKERRRHARELAAAQRESERRLTAMLREIAELRHHQARTEALTRLVAERDAALAVQTEHIARLEALVAGPTTTA